MRNRVPLFICAVALALLAASFTGAQDIKMVTRMSANGQVVSESTSYIKGARKRTEQKIVAQGMDERMARMMPSVAQVYQCDKRRMLQINDRAKKYIVTSLDAEGNPVSDAGDAGGAGDTAGDAAAGTRRGGVVQYTMTITDTGQRKDMFGLKARYLKIVTDVSPGPGACTPKAHYEQEGWYADFEADMYCSSRSAAAPAQAATRAGCQDTIRYKTIGTAKMGFPLSMTSSMTDQNGRQVSMKQEVVDLKVGPLDASLFDVPAGYAEAKSAQELYAAPSPAEMAAMMNGGESSGGRSDANEGSGTGGEANEAKSAGTIRIGVAVINDRSGRLGSTASLRQRLIDDLDGSELDAIALNADSPDALVAEARQKQCDFILYTDIASIKQSKAGKVGGLLGRAAGVGSGGVDKSESRVEFRLVPTASTAPRLQANATAKEEGDEQSVLAALTQEAQRVREEARRQ
jgi:hypothetical protein